MTNFIYRKVIDGEETLLPELEAETESKFPNHQREINQTLRNFHLFDWTVVISPGKEGGGSIHHGLKMIILVSSPEAAMRETLYHEIFHEKCFGTSEEEVEEMGVVFYQLIWGKK